MTMACGSTVTTATLTTFGMVTTVGCSPVANHFISPYCINQKTDWSVFEIFDLCSRISTNFASGFVLGEVGEDFAIELDVS